MGIIGSVLEGALRLVPVSLLWILGVFFGIALVGAVLSSPELIHLLLATGLMLGIVWYAVGLLPRFVRRGLGAVTRKLLGRERNGHHGH